MFRRIVVPIDDTELADRVVDTALSVAGKYGAEVHALFVRRAPRGDGLPVLDELEVETEIDSLKDAVISRIGGTGVTAAKVFPVVRTGPADVEILAAVRDLGADLVVMGTHGRHGLADALYGSTTERVLAGLTKKTALLVVTESEE